MTNASYQNPKIRKHYDVVFPIVNTIILIVLMFVTLVFAFLSRRLTVDNNIYARSGRTGSSFGKKTGR